MLQRILDEVDQCAQRLGEVESAGEQRIIASERGLDRTTLQPATHSLYGSAEKIVDRVDLGSHGDTAGRQTREIQEIGYKSIQTIGFLLDDRGPIVAFDADLLRDRFD